MTHEAFLQDIIDDPDDDGLRLIYADWLDDHGQSPRAELIRVQVELARLPAGDPRRKGPEARERRLLGEHGAEWAGALLRPLGGMVTAWKFRRGFVEKVSLEARGLQHSADELFGRAPVRDLTVYLARSRIGHLAALPHLARLSALTLRNNALGGAGARALASSPFLGGLTSLDLSRNGLGDDGVRALAASPHLSRLAALTLTDNHIGLAGALALADAFPRLELLELYWNPIEGAARRMLRARFGARVKLGG